MRRPFVASLVTAVVLVAAPLAARALFVPSITLLSPATEDIATGEVVVAWAYEGFSPQAWVDVEVRKGDDEPYTRVARVRIDDGTRGDRGSFAWASDTVDDGTDYTLRVIVPSNKSVHDSVSPLVVDNTPPEATELERAPAANDAGWHNGDVTVRWACRDATSGVVAEEVTAVVTDEGEDLTATAVCEDLAGHTTTATAEGIDIDRTAPTATLLATEPADGAPAVSVVTDITGTAGDALSGVASVVVAFTDSSGSTTERTATCSGCGTTSATWSVSTRGLTVGRYAVSATATDMADNTGAPATADYLVVAAPAPPEVPDAPEPAAPEAPDGAGGGVPPPAVPSPDGPPGATVTVTVVVDTRRS